MRPRKLLRLYKKEKDPDVRDRMWLNILVERDGMSATGAAVHMEKARSWGSTWRRRYLDEGAEGLRTRPRSGRPSRIPGEAMNRIRQKIEQEDCWTVEALYGLIQEEAGVEYDLSYVRRLLRNLGYVRKVPLRRHVRRANRWKVAWFPQEDQSTDQGQAPPRLDRRHPGRVHLRSRGQAQKERLQQEGEAANHHVRRRPFQDGRLRGDHLRRTQPLQAVRPVHQGRVRRLSLACPPEVRQDADHRRQGPPAQGGSGPGGAGRDEGRGGAVVSCPRDVPS